VYGLNWKNSDSLETKLLI